MKEAVVRRRQFKGGGGGRGEGVANYKKISSKDNNVGHLNQAVDPRQAHNQIKVLPLNITKHVHAS